MAFLKEFADFLLQRKKYWVAPVILTTLLIGTILVLAQSSVIAPFIYTLF